MGFGLVIAAIGADNAIPVRLVCSISSERERRERECVCVRVASP